jgi:7-cyano-7-deazaguanine reductase
VELKRDLEWDIHERTNPVLHQPSERTGLRVFDTPPGVTEVTFSSSELTSLCPITGQPDFSSVEISFEPDRLCLESKSLKLYLWRFRELGAFVEDLAVRICADVAEALRPHRCTVTVRQNIRGGIETVARSEIRR